MSYRQTGYVLVSILLLGSLWWTSSPSEVPGSPHPTTVDARQYTAYFRLNPSTLSLQAHTSVQLRTPDKSPITQLFLHGLTIDSLKVNHCPASYTRKQDTLIISGYLPDTVLNIDIFYHGRPQTGLYRQEYQGVEVIFTDSWPERARGWLPSIDHPRDPASFTLTLDLPTPYEAIASGRLITQKQTVDRRLWTWQLQGTAPTYAFAFAIGDFSTLRTVIADSLPVTYHLLPPDSTQMILLARVPETLFYFSRLIGRYPYSKYAVAQIPILYGGMENASIPFLQAALFPITPEGKGNRVESVQVHEAAHQWFGDAITLSDWRHLWLSEGMATYLTTLFYEHIDGPDAARWRRVEMARLSPEEQTADHTLVPAHPVDPATFLTWIPYRKGGCVLHLIRLTVGDSAFTQALKLAYKRFKGKSWTTEDWRHILEHTSKQSLKSLFDFWVYGNTLPRLYAHWDASSHTLSWRIENDAQTLQELPFELLLSDSQEHFRFIPAVGIMMEVVWE